MQSPDTTARIKSQQTTHWNAVAGGWAAWLDWTERNFRPLTDWLRTAAGWDSARRMLDVACGAGYPALAAARSVQPGATVVAIDISPEMLEASARRATAEGLHNLDFREMDAEQLQFDDDWFDSVTNAYGLMFCPEPERAIQEMHRVLKPGGRFAVVTWAEPSTNRFLGVAGEAAATFFSLPPPVPMAPGPFRLAHSAALVTLLDASRFSDLSIETRSMTCECDSISEYCQMFTELAWKTRMASLSAADALRFRDALSDAVQPFLQDSRLRLVATSHCVTGRKAAGRGLT